MSTIKVVNNLTDHSVSIKKTKLKVNDEDNFEQLSDWCDDNLTNNGFYELDATERTFIIAIEDDEPNWKVNFDEVVVKVQKYVDSL
jgi:hypothetical protein